MNFIKTNKIALKLAFRNLFENKRRTALSLSGVVIGVMLVIVVLSLGAGMKGYVMNEIEAFGSDIINVEIKVPGTDKTSTSNAGGLATGTEIKTLTLKDAEELAKLKNLGSWYAGVMTQRIASYEEKNKTVMIMGVTPGFFEIDKSTKLKTGNKFSKEDSDSSKNIVIIGGQLAEDLFQNEKEALGKKIKLGNEKFSVEGVLEKRGSSGFFDFDNIVYVPTQTVQKKLLNTNYVQWIVFKSNNTDKDDLTIKAMEKILRKNHNINREIDDDFAITSMSEATEMVDQIFSVLNILLIGLTSISLIVGGVGIMNVMFVAVTERTFEIGLRKSIGAKRRDILLQFIYEAIILTLLGGLIGMFLGLGVSRISEIIMAKLNFSLTFPVTSFSVLLAISFSVLVGLIFGYKPAQKAAKLTPIEALRKE